MKKKYRYKNTEKQPKTFSGLDDNGLNFIKIKIYWP